jgi:hypothetical protein
MGTPLLSRRARRLVLTVTLALAAVATVAVVTGVLLMSAKPSWWRPIDAADPRTVATGRQTEDLVSNRLYAVRPTEPGFVPATPGAWRSEVWTVRISAAEATAWLNTRLRAWLANRYPKFRWPEEITELQVDFADRRVRVGARVTLGGRDQFLSATLTPSIAPDGSVSLPASTVSVGRLPIPASWVIDPGSGTSYMPASLRDQPETAAMLGAFAGRRPLARDAVLRLVDGRRVRVLAVEASGGALTLTCRTETE